MSYAKFMISSLIFVVLTAIKLMMPSLADDISYEIRSVLITEQEQTTTVMELGESLTEGKLFEAFGKTDEERELIPIKEIINYANVLPEPQAEKAESETEPEDKTSPKVEAFLASQEAYSEYAVPENVSYEMPELPFEYISPIAEASYSGFGYRVHPILNDVRYHYGTDIAANTGESVYAFADGTVRAIGEDGGYGKYIIIDHADGYSTLYAHCSSLCVSSGNVSKGDVIALVGSSGAATGPHLHFELEHDGTYLNPEFYL